MSDQKNEAKTRKMTVTSCQAIHTGQGANGTYTIYEVFAVDEGGQPIDQKLRAFEDLDLNVLKEYRVQRKDHERHGTSFTLTPLDSKRTRGPRQPEPTMQDIIKRMNGLEARIAALEGTQPSSGLQSDPSPEAPRGDDPAPAPEPTQDVTQIRF